VPASSDRIGCDGVIKPEVLRRINWTMVLAIPLYRASWNKVRALQAAFPLSRDYFYSPPIFPAYTQCMCAGRHTWLPGKAPPLQPSSSKFSNIGVSCGIAGEER